MRIVVLGASGFLGSWTVRALIAAGHEVIAVSRSERPWRLGDIPGTAAAVDDWPDLIRRERPGVIVSADWAGVAAGARDGADQWANLERQDAILAAALDAGVARVVGVGSQAEYGPREDRTGETAALNPGTEYGKAKVAALRRLEKSGISFVWARVFSVYGPLDNEGLLLPTIADRVARGEAVDLSSGEQRWSYLYAPDAATAMATLATHPDASGVINLAHPEAPPLRDSVELFAQAVGGRDLLRFGAVPPRPGVVAHVDADTTRLESLGWKPAFTRAEGLTATAGWLNGETVADPLLNAVLPARARS